jgi:hypothetical protein
MSDVGLIAVLSLFPVGAVALTAVWARSPERRAEARQVLRILTLRKRVEELGDVQDDPPPPGPA